MMYFSLVLATYGRCDELSRALQSLSVQTYKEFEILIVDQNLDDRLCAIIKQAKVIGLSIRHLRQEKPNLSEARNFGIRQARGEVIGFPDDDCWYEPDTLAEIAKHFSNAPLCDGAIACWVEQSKDAPLQPNPPLLSLGAWRQFRGGDASSISLFFRKTLLSKLNGFDVRFGVGQWFGAGEETDLVLHALSNGAHLVRCPQARVHHHLASAVTHSWLSCGRVARNRARGTGGLYAKHHISVWIILRGLLAPIGRPLLRGNLKAAFVGGFTVMGRIEGLLWWNQQ
jgi:GT2 family glycosyltransferase